MKKMSKLTLVEVMSVCCMSNSITNMTISEFLTFSDIISMNLNVMSNFSLCDASSDVTMISKTLNNYGCQKLIGLF